MLEKHYGHTSNVASAVEVAKGRTRPRTFKSDEKAKAEAGLRMPFMPDQER